MDRCKGKTISGNRCKKAAGEDGYCYLHQDQQGMHVVDLPQDASYRQPPEYLNDTGRRYWGNYVRSLANTDFTEYAKLGDLCYWEQRKTKTIANLEKGKEVFVYRKQDGTVKHVQPSAFFTNLRNIQGEINTLRAVLFPEAVDKQKVSPVEVYEKKKAKSW